MCSVMFFYGFVAVGFNGLGFQHELLTSTRRDLWRELYVLDASKCGLLSSAQMKQLQLFAEKAEIQLMFFYSRSNGCEKFRQPALTGHLDRYEMYISYVPEPDV